MKKTLINIFKQYPILRKMNPAKKKIDKAKQKRAEKKTKYKVGFEYKDRNKEW